jgi:DNA modification methylase
VAALVEVFRGVKRVLRDDGTLWVVLGDSYASGEVGRHDSVQGRSIDGKRVTSKQHGEARIQRRMERTVPAKSLLGIPWRVAFALQDDGWILRAEIIWHKPSAMPESVKDRVTRAHETVFMLAKAPRYFYDQEAIREAASPSTAQRAAQGTGRAIASAHAKHRSVDGADRASVRSTLFAYDFVSYVRNGRNRRSVWTVATSPLSAKKFGLDLVEHYAAFPPELVRPMIRAATSERGVCPACGAPWQRVVERGAPARIGGLVGASAHMRAGKGGHGQWDAGHMPLVRPVRTTGWQPTCRCDAGEPQPAVVADIFCGSGTTGYVAVQEGRRFIGIDVNADYLRLCAARIATAQPPLLLEATGT